MLELLMRRSGRVVPKDVAESQVFGPLGSVASNAIEVYVHRLRRQLAEHGATVHIHPPHWGRAVLFCAMCCLPDHRVAEGSHASQADVDRIALACRWPKVWHWRPARSHRQNDPAFPEKPMRPPRDRRSPREPRRAARRGLPLGVLRRRELDANQVAAREGRAKIAKSHRGNQMKRRQFIGFRGPYDGR